MHSEKKSEGIEGIACGFLIVLEIVCGIIGAVSGALTAEGLDDKKRDTKNVYKNVID